MKMYIGSGKKIHLEARDLDMLVTLLAFMSRYSLYLVIVYLL